MGDARMERKLKETTHAAYEWGTRTAAPEGLLDSRRSVASAPLRLLEPSRDRAGSCTFTCAMIER
jgi:hypothetical protein